MEVRNGYLSYNLKALAIIPQPLINILIRTSYRPEQFARCLESIAGQTYRNIRIVIGYDDDRAQEYIPDELEQYYMAGDPALPYFYDTYCNRLKELVTDGWFLFLDDDDVLTSPTVLRELSEHLSGPHEAIICQFLRNGVPKPRNNYIKNRIIAEGKIGLPCLVLHSKHREVGALDGDKAGDYRYIKYVTSLVNTKFIALPLVSASPRGYGQMEPTLQKVQK